ncbi:response regulator transcription factor [Candidatus Zixiibacteriota bacterium]
MEKILIVEDEEHILMALQDDLTLEGYEVTPATDGELGLTLARESAFDLIILDIMLPRMNGFDVCRQLRQSGINTPIIILSAKGLEIDKVLGLELGADDYITKPFSPRELTARIKAILRRVRKTRQGIEVCRFSNVEVDFQRREAKKNNEPIFLTSLEFALLRFLIENKDKALSRNEILDGVWGQDVLVYDRTVDTHMGHLRKKVEDNPANPRHIIGVRGVGYRFKD